MIPSSPLSLFLSWKSLGPGIAASRDKHRFTCTESLARARTCIYTEASRAGTPAPALDAKEWDEQEKHADTRGVCKLTRTHSSLHGA